MFGREEAGHSGVDVIDGKPLRVEAAVSPGAQFLIAAASVSIQYPQEIGISRRPAAVLRRTGASTCLADGIGSPHVRIELSLAADLVLPAFAEVLEIDHLCARFISVPVQDTAHRGAADAELARDLGFTVSFRRGCLLWSGPDLSALRN